MPHLHDEIEIVARLFRETITKAKTEAAIPEDRRPVLHRINICNSGAHQATAQAAMIIGRASEYGDSSAGRDLIQVARLWCDGAFLDAGNIQ